jgi:hypothetical protein
MMMMMMIKMTNKSLASLLLVACLFLFDTSAALAPTQNLSGAANSQQKSRRDIFQSSLTAAAALAVTASSSFSEPAHAATTGSSSAFVGTYSDPINHPGGTRTIRLLEGQSSVVGDYQLAEIQGGGGVGEPKSYVLPAVIFGDRAIVIDFSPKGGPRDFTGVLDGTNGIKFLKDGNKWPRLN